MFFSLDNSSRYHSSPPSIYSMCSLSEMLFITPNQFGKPLKYCKITIHFKCYFLYFDVPSPHLVELSAYRIPWKTGKMRSCLVHFPFISSVSMKKYLLLESQKLRVCYGNKQLQNLSGWQQQRFISWLTFHVHCELAGVSFCPAIQRLRINKQLSSST